MTNYQGTDNLQLLEKTAKNYNTFLINLVTQAGQKRREEKRREEKRREKVSLLLTSGPERHFLLRK